MSNNYIIGMILYKYIKGDKLEFIRILNVYKNQVTLLRLNDKKIFKNINIDKISRYNILNSHIAISHLKCKDTNRLLVKSIKELKVPNYIYDDSMKFHYEISSFNIIGFNQISNPLEVNKLHLYYIDDIKETLEIICKYNNKYNIMKSIITEDLINDIYYDNNIEVINEDLEYDNDRVIKYHLGLNLNTISEYKIINAKNGIFINK